MKRTARGWTKAGGRATLLAGFLVLQSVAAIFFVGDAVLDFASNAFSAHMVIEAIIAIVLVVGVVLGALQMRRVIERAERGEAAVAAASGAFGELVKITFEDWRLTAAESEIALLTLKGFDVAEIARIRGSAAGTVRAQLTRVYSKAGVSSRAQFMSLFLQDLLDGPVGRTDEATVSQKAAV
jgi:DNA-binding CsgD family transcriptional regulator